MTGRINETKQTDPDQVIALLEAWEWDGTAYDITVQRQPSD